MVDIAIKPDFRKGLPVLHSEWKDCQRCSLGQYRVASGGAFVFGEGTSGGVMFIGEGPGKDEAAEGRPFIGASGRLLRYVIKKLGLTNYYITNAVCCRSCAPQFDTEGNPMLRRDGSPVIKDQAPAPQHVAMCRPRLFEEIYIVDPAIIIALGKQAAEAVARQSISISSDSGTPITVSIPGAGSHPSVTEKKKEWARRVKKQFVMPTEQNEVEYLMVPVLHPAYCLSRHVDQRNDNPLQSFVRGIKFAVSIYQRQRLEVFGDTVDIGDLTENDLLEAM